MRAEPAVWPRVGSMRRLLSDGCPAAGSAPPAASGAGGSAGGQRGPPGPSDGRPDGPRPRPDPYPDCKCEVKGACKKVVSFAAVPPSTACSEVRASAQQAPSGAGRGGAHRPEDCPCRAALMASPPATLATGDIYRTCKLPKRFQHPAWFSGYDAGPKHPLYRTTASDIGRFPPTVHTVATIYRPADRAVSKQLGPAGPWRNRSLCHTGSIWDSYSYNNFY